MKETLLFAAMGTGFTFLMTTLGASIVFFIKREIEQKLQRAFLGFAAGVMLAASLWSLLIPATEGAQEAGQIGWLPAAGGFLLGGLFLFGLDILVRRLRSKKIEKNEKQELLQENFLLLSAVTLHNIPEGMAVGLAFAMAADNPMEPALYAAAWALAFGIGIQNFPEGAAISLPLRQEGIGRRRAFLYGSLSGIVEPVFGVGITLFASGSGLYMSWILAFAAGAMIYVIVEELIPQAKEDRESVIGTVGFMAGFVLMMILDVAL